MNKKAIRFILGIASFLGLFLLLFTIGGMDAGTLEGMQIGRLLAGLALFGLPLAGLALMEAGESR